MRYYLLLFAFSLQIPYIQKNHEIADYLTEFSLSNCPTEFQTRKTLL